MKKILFTLALALVLTPFVSMAQTTTKGIKASKTDLECVKNAVSVREDALIGAFSKFNTSMTSALSAKKTALLDAWSKTEKKERQDARKSAWSTFKSAKKSAASSYKSEKKAAWSTFKSTVTSTCKAVALGGEETEKGAEEPAL